MTQFSDEQARERAMVELHERTTQSTAWASEWLPVQYRDAWDRALAILGRALLTLEAEKDEAVRAREVKGGRILAAIDKEGKPMTDLKSAVERLTAMSHSSQVSDWSDHDWPADLRLVLSRLAALEREVKVWREASSPSGRDDLEWLRLMDKRVAEARAATFANLLRLQQR